MGCKADNKRLTCFCFKYETFSIAVFCFACINSRNSPIARIVWIPFFSLCCKSANCKSSSSSYVTKNGVQLAFVAFACCFLLFSPAFFSFFHWVTLIFYTFFTPIQVKYVSIGQYIIYFKTGFGTRKGRSLQLE